MLESRALIVSSHISVKFSLDLIKILGNSARRMERTKRLTNEFEKALSELNVNTRLA